jgi:hypothetical protein
VITRDKLQFPEKPDKVGTCKQLGRVDSSNSIAPNLFLLDTQTGYVWIYKSRFQFKSAEGKIGETADYMALIFVAQTQ